MSGALDSGNGALLAYKNDGSAMSHEARSHDPNVACQVPAEPPWKPWEQKRGPVRHKKSVKIVNEKVKALNKPYPSEKIGEGAKRMR